MRSLVLIACVAVLSACSGSPNESARDVAASLPCLRVESDEVFGASDSVSCELDEGTVRVSWFDSVEARDSFEVLADAASSSGLPASEIVYGGDWAVECDTDAACDVVRDRLR